MTKREQGKIVRLAAQQQWGSYLQGQESLGPR